MKNKRYARTGIAVFGLCTAFVQGFTAAMAEERGRPVLYEFMTQVTQDHPALKASEAALKAARARSRGQSRPVYNPTLELGYEDAESTTKEIGVSQAFDMSGKRRARTGVGNATVQAAEAAHALARKTLVSEILQALADYHTARRMVGVASERESLSAAFLALSQRRSDAGEMPRAELLTAKLALAEARAAGNEATAALSRAKEKLTAVTGQTHEVWPRLDGVPATTEVVSDPSVYDQLPELRLAKARTDTSRARIKLAKSDRLPDPTVGVRVGDEGGSSLVGLSLSVPIRVRNNFRAEVDAAGADLIEARQQYHALNRQLRARFDASLRRYEAAADAWRLWQSHGAAPLGEQRALLGKLLEAREISAIDYLVQLNQTFATESASIALKGRLWNSWFSWQNASGMVGEWLETLS